MSDTLTGTGTATTAEIPHYPMARAAGCPFAPPPDALALAETKPLSRVRIWDGSTPWLITGYAEVRALFSDSRVSVDDRRPGFPHWNEGMLSTVHKRPRSVFTSDAEEHTRFRRMLSKPFTFKRVEGLRPAIQQITNEHIDAMLAGPRPADIVTALALPVPSLVISQLLGVPYEDAEFFQHHANIGLGRYATAEDTGKGAAGLAKYLARLVEAKMAEPAEDAVSDLADRVRAGEIDVREAAQLGTGLLIAGHETTANMIGLGTLALLANPEQLAALRTPKTRRWRTRWRNCCATSASFRTASAGLRWRTSRSPARSSAPARASSSTSRRRTGTRRYSTNPTGWTFSGRAPVRTSRSVTAGISASASSSRGRNYRLCSARCCVASRRCGWRSRSMRFPSNTTGSHTAFTNCP
jgi:cytochrome P450